MYKYHKLVLDQSSWCFSAKEEPSINIFMLSSVLIEHCELQLSYRKLIKTFLNNFWQFCINFTLFWDSLSQNSCRPTNSCTYRVLANMYWSCLLTVFLLLLVLGPTMVFFKLSPAWAGLSSYIQVYLIVFISFVRSFCHMVLGLSLLRWPCVFYL